MSVQRVIAAVVLGMTAIVPIAALSQTEEPRAPEQVFSTRCAYCHDATGWGTRALARRMPESEAPLLDRKDLPPAYTVYVVRRGIGSMPQFNPSELTDKELESLANWLENRR